ncbi:MAG: ABC transporter ATP-binding protein/permease [Solobacterium sp.]|jgi:ATP-binding cassette subfamily B protein|nr:ABC transporter ATP-binding protein/permease [Solobacterium sp.]MCH4222665.1 ABC transporter ATP-binding protein/permease [Solobacterium sp.]MCH4265813.1 ABC transporter ATP-binding protein/permease [Solobacterium sp.]
MKQNREQITSGMNTFKKVMKYIGSFRILLVLSILTACGSVVLSLYSPILFGDAIDGMISAGNVDFSLVQYYLSRILLVVVSSGILTWLMNMINNRMTYRVVQEIRNEAIRHLQVLPLSYLDSHSSGDLESRIIADVDQLSDGLLLGFTQLFSGVVTIIFTLIFMLSKSVIVTLIVIVLTPLSFFAAKYIASHSYRMFKQQSSTRGEETALIEEMISGQKVVQAFGYEERSSARFQEINERLKDSSWKATFYSSLTNPSTRFVNSIIYAIVALAGAMLIAAGSLTVGGLSVLLSYANQYMKPFNDISSVITELQNALACAGRVFEVIEAEPESKDPTEQLNTENGLITAEDISFSYMKERPLLEHVSFTANPGTRIAIVGPTGCGKTTLINLLMRFYDVNEGVIKADDVDIRTVARHSLRKRYGMVLQDTWLKDGTVRENITFGKPNATKEEQIAACKKAHSWEFIRRMPQGLDTIITEDSLSQGQKQLLCITRVMLCVPSVLILDEATSSIDTRTELQIQDAFDQLMEGRTSFVVAHRLSTIRSADEILVMKDGKIIERGNHNALMKQNGFYHQLYESQFAKAE